MFNQNWHVVYGPVESNMDVGGDTQLTDVYEIVYRMSGVAGAPGPEIVQYVYGEYDDPNGQKPDGTWPDIVVTTMTGYEIRERNGDVNDADYTYESSGLTYPDAEAAFAMAKKVADLYAESPEHADIMFDWNGVSAMHREGGPV